MSPRTLGPAGALSAVLAIACSRCGGNSAHPASEAGAGSGSSSGSSGGAGTGTGDEADGEVGGNGRVGQARPRATPRPRLATGPSSTARTAARRSSSRQASRWRGRAPTRSPGTTTSASRGRRRSSETTRPTRSRARRLSPVALLPGGRDDANHPRTGINGWQGFGYIVRPLPERVQRVDTQSVGGTYSTVLAGRHHAIHEFKWDINTGRHGSRHRALDVPTGRAHPLFAITLDSSATTAGTVVADTRSPYGDLAWDNGADGRRLRRRLGRLTSSRRPAPDR